MCAARCFSCWTTRSVPVPHPAGTMRPLAPHTLSLRQVGEGPQGRHPKRPILTLSPEAHFQGAQSPCRTPHFHPSPKLPGFELFPLPNFHGHLFTASPVQTGSPPGPAAGLAHAEPLSHRPGPVAVCEDQQAAGLPRQGIHQWGQVFPAGTLSPGTWGADRVTGRGSASTKVIPPLPLDSQVLETIVSLSEPEARVLVQALPWCSSVLHVRHPRSVRSGTPRSSRECNILGTQSWISGSGPGS